MKGLIGGRAAHQGTPRTQPEKTLPLGIMMEVASAWSLTEPEAGFFG